MNALRRQRDDLERKYNELISREHQLKHQVKQLTGQNTILRAGTPSAGPGADSAAVAAAAEQLNRGVDPHSIVKMLGNILQNKDRQLQQARGELHDTQRRCKQEAAAIRECAGPSLRPAPPPQRHR